MNRKQHVINTKRLGEEHLPPSISNKQAFISNNIGVLATSVFRTSLAIQRYTDLITEQQNRLNAIMTAIDDGILLLEKDGTPIIQNEMGAKYYQKLCKCDDRCVLHDTIRQIQNQGMTTLNREITQDNQTYHLKLTRILQHNDSDRISIRIRCSDEEPVHRLSDHIPVINALTSALAHEINNPLTPIICLTSPPYINSERITDMNKELQTIHRAGGRIADVIKLLLNFKEVHQWGNKSSVSINSVMLDITKQLKPEFKKNNIHIWTRFAPNSPVVFSNRAQLRQVIIYVLNSLCNSHADKDQPTTITLNSQLKNNEVRIVIHFTKTGRIRTSIGEECDVQEKFEMPFQDLQMLLAELLAHHLQIKVECMNEGKVKKIMLTLPQEEG